MTLIMQKKWRAYMEKKIDNEMTWQDTSCYKTLKKEFKKRSRDFSALKSQYDYDD